MHIYIYILYIYIYMYIYIYIYITKRHLLSLFNNISEYFDSFVIWFIYIYIYIFIYILRTSIIHTPATKNKKPLNLFNRMHFRFLQNLYQVYPVTCSANISRHTPLPFGNLLENLQLRGQNQRLSNIYFLKVKSLKY